MVWTLQYFIFTKFYFQQPLIIPADIVIPASCFEYSMRRRPYLIHLFLFQKRQNI